MIRLYDYELSGNCYKLRLLMHWLGLPFERIPVDFHPGRAHKSDAFVQNVNPLGQLPVLDDDGFVLRDAQAGLMRATVAGGDRVAVGIDEPVIAVPGDGPFHRAIAPGVFRAAGKRLSSYLVLTAERSFQIIA